MRVTILIATIMALLMLNGCTMIPRYERPLLPVPEAWPASAEAAMVSAPENISWETFFPDETMRVLIRTALDNNRDMRIALLNIERARALYYIQQADLLPTINAGADMTVQHQPSEYTATRVQGITRQYSVTVGFTSYELDLFGRVRSLRESALQSYLATEEGAKSTQVSLVSEVVGAYLQLVTDRETLVLARDTYENRKEVLKLLESQFEFGVASQLEVNQAKTGVEEARVMAAQYETRVAQDTNALTLLLGTAIPTDLPLASRLADVPRLPDLSPGLPSELILRRPDIIGSEHQLLAANANIGAARANFFPRIGISSSIGTITPEFNDLFSGGSGTWLFSPVVTLPLFDTGRNLSNLWVSEADRDIAVATYEKTIQAAFREVADALAQRANIGEQLAGQTALVEAAQTTYDLSLARYDAGIDTFLTVLDAQRTLMSAQQGLINAYLLREVNVLNLYKALGGGWQ